MCLEKLVEIRKTIEVLAWISEPDIYIKKLSKYRYKNCGPKGVSEQKFIMIMWRCPFAFDTLMGKWANPHHVQPTYTFTCVCVHTHRTPKLNQG